MITLVFAAWAAYQQTLWFMDPAALSGLVSTGNVRPPLVFTLGVHTEVARCDHLGHGEVLTDTYGWQPAQWVCDWGKK